MGFLSKDVKDLKEFADAFCTRGCVNCYWYSPKGNNCPGELVTNLVIDLEELKKSISSFKTSILRLL